MFDKNSFINIWHRINSRGVLFQWINRLTIARTYFLSTFMLVLIGLADYLSHVELTLSPWYTFPCFLMDWRIGRKSALAYAVFATVLQLLIGITGTHSYPNMYYLVADLVLNLAFCIVLIWIIAKLRLALEMETILSRSDFLTKLANRESLLDGIEKEMNRCRRQGSSLTVALIDLSNFKRFNDTRGHSTGDLLLAALAELLRENFRSTDLIARTGDDEFTLLLPSMARDVTESKLRALRKGIDRLMLSRGWQVTFSMAAIVVGDPSSSGEQVLHEVEHLMQHIKQTDKNGFILRELPSANADAGAAPTTERQTC